MSRIQNSVGRSALHGLTRQATEPLKKRIVYMARSIGISLSSV